MTEHRPRRRIVLLLIVAALAAGIGVVFSLTGALGQLELSSVDARFHVRGDRSPPSEVVIVGIDQKTLDADPKDALPLNRKRGAKVLEQLRKAGARVIASTIQYTSFSDDPGADDAIAQAAMDTPRLVLGTADLNPQGLTNIFGGGEALKSIGATPGYTDLPDDADGRVRQLQFRERKTAGFAVAAARLYRNGKLTLPAGNQAWIDYPGKPGTIREISYADVENGRLDPRSVRGKVVVIGPTLSSSLDSLQTPTSGKGETRPAS